MPLNVFWDNEAKTIIRSEGEGEWTWEEFHEGLQKIVEMMKTVDHRVDLIHNHQPGSKRPSGSGMPHFQRAIRVMPPNVGLTVFVNTNAFARAIVAIFTRVYSKQAGGNFVMVGSLEEAYNLIAKERARGMTSAP
jgi:hypothetical protein